MGKIHFVKVRSQKIQCKGDNNHELHYAIPYDCRGFGWSGQAVTGVFNFWRYMAKSLASWRFKSNDSFYECLPSNLNYLAIEYSDGAKLVGN